MRVAGQPYKIFFFLQIIIFPFVSKAATGEPVIDSVPEFGNKKEIPKQFEKPILTALSYFPELKKLARDLLQSQILPAYLKERIIVHILLRSATRQLIH